jgi:hypothetical protein
MPPIRRGIATTRGTTPAPVSNVADLASQVRALTSTVTALVDRERSREESAESSRAVEIMAQAMARMTSQLTHGRGTDSESEGEGPDPGNAEELSIPDVRVADPRFKVLLSIEPYRLSRRGTQVLPRDVAKLSKKAAELRPRVGRYFGGSPPLAVLPFLQRVREIAEEAGITEGLLLRLLPDLLTDPALTSFRSAKPKTYPEAVKWFLLTYAPESRVAESWRDLQQIRQEDPETATEFAQRLQTAAHQLGDLVSPAELKALYEGGLLDGTRHLFRATLPPDPNRSLSDSVAAAEALSQAVRATRAEHGHPPGNRQRGPFPRGVFAISENPGTLPLDTVDFGEDNMPREKSVFTEVDFGTVVCYGAPIPGADARPRTRNRLCWTCWLPGHFSDECPLVPATMRATIAERKRVALAQSGHRHSQPVPRGPGFPRPWERQMPSLKPPEALREPDVTAGSESGNEDRRGADAPAPRL